MKVVYEIRCAVTGWVYVGSTTQLTVRHREHWTRLKGGNHRNRRLQAAWDEHGALRFELAVVERVNGEPLALAEQRRINARRAEGHCYNIGVAACPVQLLLPLGWPPSRIPKPESRPLAMPPTGAAKQK